MHGMDVYGTTNNHQNGRTVNGYAFFLAMWMDELGDVPYMIDSS